MASQDISKCINPWFGLLIIALICVVISAAVFVEFNPSGEYGKSAQRKGSRGHGAVKAAYPLANEISPAGAPKTIVF